MDKESGEGIGYLIHLFSTCKCCIDIIIIPFFFFFSTVLVIFVHLRLSLFRYFYSYY